MAPIRIRRRRERREDMRGGSEVLRQVTLNEARGAWLSTRYLVRLQLAYH
jgi:hypothetical protein